MPSEASTSYYYKQLGIGEGLSQSKVQCILNDHKGYLWIGTEYGLNRYDHNSLKQYLHQTDNEHTLPDNNITFLAEDSLQNLWVGTVNGLALYDRYQDKFITPQINGKNIQVNSCLPVEGGLLIAGSGVLYKYVYRDMTLKIIYDATSPNLYVPFLQMIRYDERSILINSRWSGIYRYDLQQNKLTKLEELDLPKYSRIFLDSRGNLWISPYAKGLYCYRDMQLVRHFTTANSPLTYNVIHDIIEKDGKLWVATDGEGINLISLDDFSFDCIRQTRDDLNSFPAKSIYCLYTDANDNMWAGSIRNGLIGIRKVEAHSYRQVPFGNHYGLSTACTNRFYQDSKDIIWIATDGGGINRFDTQTGLFKHYPDTQEDKAVCITEYTPQELMFFSFNKGIYIFNKETGHTRPFILLNPQENREACVNNGQSVQIKRIDSNLILFTTHKHIILYDMTKKSFHTTSLKESGFERMSPYIIAAKEGKAYLTDTRRICEYDTRTHTVKSVYNGKQGIKDACMAQDGSFWIGTTEGLVHCQPQTGEAELIETTLFKEVSSIIIDRKQRVWIGTRKNLCMYSPHTRKFVQADEEDGIQPNDYLPRATLLTREGDILIGGTNGMSVINEEIDFEVDNRHSIELLDVLLNGLPLNREQLHKTEKKIKIPHDFSSLQLKVLLNENNAFRKNIFHFHIEGLKEQFAQSGSNQLNINYLPIGEYTITATYYMHNGTWSPRQELLHITVMPPWWKSDWFFLSVFLLTALTLCTAAYLYDRKKEMQQRQRAMQLKSKLNEEKVNFLTNISHELRTPLTLICAPLKRMLDHMQESHELKSQLQLVYRQAFQMKDIIDMVLDVRKLEEGKEVLHVLPHPLNEWVRSVGGKFAGEYAAKRIGLLYELDERITDVPFDSGKCEFVLSNFLMNALKFSEAGSTTTIITSLCDDNDRVRISVKDEGMGLSQVNPESLFSNFYQGKHEKGGSGLGLSYAKSLIGYHKGRIGAESISGEEKGAVFYYELPLQAANTQQAEVATLADTSSVKESIDCGEVSPQNMETYIQMLQKCSLVIVEDTDELREYLKGILRDYFGHIYTAKDGKEGLLRIKDRQPDIIISDVMMPCMNGFELCRQVKEDLEISHIPFILLTAYHNAQNMNTGYKNGADAFLPKPFNVDTLLNVICNQLKTRTQIRARYKEENLLTVQEVSFSNADETFLLKLNTLINDNLSNSDLDVTFLAGNLCISRSLLFNKIKTITGMGIVEYINKQRIEKAKLLLNTTDMTLTEISELVGFSTLRYFSKVFKNLTGEIPSAYRKHEGGSKSLNNF